MISWRLSGTLTRYDDAIQRNLKLAHLCFDVFHEINFLTLYNIKNSSLLKQVNDKWSLIRETSLSWRSPSKPHTSDIIMQNTDVAQTQHDFMIFILFMGISSTMGTFGPMDFNSLNTLSLFESVHQQCKHMKYSVNLVSLRYYYIFITIFN